MIDGTLTLIEPLHRLTPILWRSMGVFPRREVIHVQRRKVTHVSGREVILVTMGGERRVSRRCTSHRAQKTHWPTMSHSYLRTSFSYGVETSMPFIIILSEDSRLPSDIVLCCVVNRAVHIISNKSSPQRGQSFVLVHELIQPKDHFDPLI